ncbi:dihydroxyacetone kinase [Ameyamaea chiangmaiensis NBRC 103196]|uniref:Dihydroxyacetone kinase subunit DhaK n=1 Tax=Ameyamaea chiangmaiensis TaxID=442969 RepID=A0A850P8F2_9PROT|nr:dihydroxyacetone kinase subunit DhaK [Ameyamaea chiangmaiensis]MBS4075559.1 dihydroxyacetone kinase subunit DhaK [Ameyamaea chiangmaiensis]NVN40244.1 dihydroxyacetone kinase subunit DhaK [Ameyamaea chiangmaiensis]GBQ69316.1 dihydroxyacetone kinase [Ameyamaea chiangmaiensis NBRC 103196]
MKRFINQRDTLVPDAIAGLLRSSDGRDLTCLDGLPDIRVVLRRDWQRDRVAIISGGGSGHEPAHAGFVGRGMLTAAVVGSIFASPSVDAILAAILAVTGDAGCLLIIKNYTGDRLNFGLAAEQARALGRKVETVTVRDDIALAGHESARGIAGTIAVHKAAGFRAEAGESLENVAAFARDVAGRLRSIGLSLSDCNAYDADHAPRLGDREAELGLGIHGEPGARRIDCARADDLMALAAETVERTLSSDGPQAVMLNNLGIVPEIEMSLLADAFFRTPLARRTEALIGPAPLMTALDMNGFSLTTIALTPDILAALTAPVGPRAWPGVAPCTVPDRVPMPPLPDALGAPPSADPTVRALLDHAVQRLLASEAELNALDAAIGDGDAGSTFAGIARQVEGVLDRLPLADTPALFRALGALFARHGGGSSGVLLSILFSAAGRHEGPWPQALAEGLAAMQAHGGAKPGDKTMIDAIAPAIESLCRGDGAADAALAARRGAEATRRMKAGAGRASYVPGEQADGAIDPGAEAVARVAEIMAEGSRR